MIRNLLLDLDGTLLPLDQEQFTNMFIRLATDYFTPHAEWGGPAFVETVTKCLSAVAKNDGTVTNEERFWKAMERRLPGQTEAIRDAFLRFYATSFDVSKIVSRANPLIPELLRKWKQKGYRLFVATMPIFPSSVQRKRLDWAGIEGADRLFEHVTSSENCSFCKPNPSFFTEICEKFGLRPEECLMAGNDTTEDMIAAETGMQVFLLTDCLYNRKKKDVNLFPHGSWTDLDALLDAGRG